MKPSSQSHSAFGSFPPKNGKESAPNGPRSVRDVPEPESDLAPSEASKLERVRDLLFGEQAAEQNRGLAALEKRLEEGLRRLDAESADLEARFEARVTAATGAIASEIRGEIEALSRRLEAQGVQKLERSEFRNILSDLAKRIGE